MNNNRAIAQILESITVEQWEAVLCVSEVVGTRLVAEISKINKEEAPKEFTSSEENLRFRVINLIKKIGVPPHIQGYNYLQDAVMLVLEDGNNIRNIVKGLYGTIAEKYGSKGTRIERSIRHALDIAYENCDPEIFDGIFQLNGERPTNSFAIAALAEYIKMYD